MLVSVRIKDFFFDRLRVIARVEKDRLRFLRNAGGFARKTARTSMKRKGKARPMPKGKKARERWALEIRKQPASPPGSPPFCHTDDAVVTLKNILFAYDMGSGGLVVGPVGLRHKYSQSQGGIIPPALHEHGGETKIPEKEVLFSNGGRKWVARGKGVRPNQRTRNRTAKYPARPFMAPAMAKTQSKFKNLWFSNGRAAG
jgi:hypothetical protein